ncbi:MAG: sporulation protein YunB [Limnochordales bacterium]
MGVARRRLLLAAAALLTAGVVSALVTDAMLRPPLEAWASARAVTTATHAIAAVVREQLLAQLDAEELFQATTDADGNVVLIDYNMVVLNRLRAEAAHHIQRRLEELAHDELPMPLGLLTGLDFLAARGPRVPIRIVPVGAVTAVPRSDFTSAGINVVNHRLYIHVVVTMRIVAPYFDMTVPVEQEIVLANQIVPGKVPHVFVGIEGIDLRQLRDGVLALPGSR